MNSMELFPRNYIQGYFAQAGTLLDLLVYR